MLPRILLSILLLASSFAVYAAGPHGTQPGQPYTDSGAVVLTDQVAQAIADTGAGFVRVNFRLGPNQSDTPAWYAAYDGIVDRLRSRGLEIIALMTNEAWPGTPAQWQANAYETTGGNGWNPYLQNWCNFFLRAATHWKGKIKYWELWNEPDCLAVIYPSNYGALLANAYDLARTNNLPVVIIGGGICGGDAPFGATYLSNTYNVSINHTGWFTQMKNKWGTYPLDHIGYHVYPNHNGYLDVSNLSNHMDGVFNAYAAYEGAGTQKKIFLTETGWATNNVSESVQAANLTSLFNLLDSKPYIKNISWFFLQDVPPANLYFGVFRSGGLGETYKKPAWTSLKTACTYEGRWSAGGAIDQPILDYYNAHGHIKMGNPYNNGGTAWVHNWDFGPVQDYDGGEFGRMIVFNSADGSAYSARGPFFQAALNHHSALEFPLGDQVPADGGLMQKFEGGFVMWSEDAGTRVTFYPHKTLLDNSDTGFSASNNWSLQTATDAYGGNYRRRRGTATNSEPAVWTLSVPQAGHYDVYVRYPAVTGATASASYTVSHADGTTTVNVDQRSRSGRWNLLGQYRFTAGSATVSLSSQGPGTDYISADAVRIIGPMTGPDTTPPTIPVVTDDGQYTTSSTQLHASWESQDAESGIEHYEYAIGTSPTDPGSGYLVTWTSTGAQNSVTRTLPLTNGTTYYFYVRAYNGAGLMSQGVSDGITVDTTGPSIPVVTDDGTYTGNTSMLHFSWSSSDAESGISTYEYSIGTNPFGADIVPVTDIGTATQVWASGLNLTPGQYYYVTVRARNGAGVWSPLRPSDGIMCRFALQRDRIADILALGDASVVMLTNKVVTASFADRFYLMEPDRSRGICVNSVGSLSEGALVEVTGALDTTAGERRIIPGCITPLP